MCTSSVSNVIYHKFSHGAAFYMPNGKNVNVMLEYYFDAVLLSCTETEYPAETTLPGKELDSSAKQKLQQTTF